MIVNEGFVLRESWQVKRLRRRLQYFNRFGLTKAELERRDILTDGGNIYQNGCRVGIWGDGEKDNISIFYTDFGSEGRLDPNQVELSLLFKETLDEYQIPYTGRPSEEYLKRELSKMRRSLSKLISVLK